MYIINTDEKSAKSHAVISRARKLGIGQKAQHHLRTCDYSVNERLYGVHISVPYCDVARAAPLARFARRDKSRFMGPPTCPLPTCHDPETGSSPRLRYNFFGHGVLVLFFGGEVE